MPDNNKDYSELASLVKKAMGERNISQYSKDTGVSISHISRLLSQKLNAIPSQEIIAKLTKSENADPREGITYEDMMIAAGYQHNYQQLEIDLQEECDSTPDNEDLDRESNARKKEGLLSDRLREFKASISQLEAIATGILFGKLAEKGITFKSVPVDILPAKGYRPKIVLKIDDKMLKTMWIEFLFFTGHENAVHGDYRTKCFWLMGRLVMQEPDPDRITVIVTDSIRVFEYLRSVSKKISYMGNLTAVLIDQQSVGITNEVCISNCKNNVDSQIPIFVDAL